MRHCSPIIIMNVKILIKLFFSAFIFFFLLLLISAIVALPPKSQWTPLPLPSREMIIHHHHRPHHHHNHHHRTSTATKADENVQAQYQVLHIKNATPFFLDGGRRHRPVKPTNNRREAKMKKKRIKTTTAASSSASKKKGMMRSKSRPFSVMLPKGFVPPSGSTPACHNDKPDTKLTVYSCRLSAALP
ncbi:hypothetical protein LINPERHAP2_LOCUS14906 [Linum perenne]